MGRAIVREPAAFLMDEPLSNLDAKLRVQMRAEVSRLQQRLGTTTVYVTHDQTEAMTLGDRVAVMRGGVLQQFDTPRELYNNPRNLFVAGFIGSPAMNFFGGTLEGDVAEARRSADPARATRCAGASPPRARAPADVIVGVRPEDFEDAELASDKPGGFTFEAPIELVESMGSEIYAHFGFQRRPDRVRRAARAGRRTPGRPTSRAAPPRGRRPSPRLDPTSDVRIGRNARLWLDTRKVHVFDPKDGTSLTNEPQQRATA